jgi:hypothetical protein
MSSSKVGKIIKKINSQAKPTRIIKANESDTEIDIDNVVKNNEINEGTGTKIKSTSTLINTTKSKVDDILTKHDEYGTLEAFRGFAEHLKYSPLETASANYKHLNISNSLLGDIQNIILKVHKLRIRNIYQVSNKIKQSVPIRFSIYTGLPENNRLLTFITRLENEIARRVKIITGNKHLILSSCITKYSEYYPDLRVSAPFTRIGTCVEFGFEVYGKRNKRVNFESITKGVRMSSYIELDHVWVGENNFGINWAIKSAKVYPERYWSDSLFDSSDEEEEEITMPKECYHCMYCPNNHVRTHCCLGTNDIGMNQQKQFTAVYPIYPSVSNQPSSIIIPPPPAPPLMNISIKNTSEGHSNNEKSLNTFVPSLSDLLAGRSKLKSVVSNNITDNDNTNSVSNSDENDDKSINFSDIKKNLKNIN